MQPSCMHAISIFSTKIKAICFPAIYRVREHAIVQENALNYYYAYLRTFCICLKERHNFVQEFLLYIYGYKNFLWHLQ